MPLYDYKCQSEKCSNVFEVQHKISESGPKECPKCGHEEVKKLISPVHGSVELTGHDLRAKIKEDTRKLKEKARNDENFNANLVGEDKFQANTSLRDKIKKEGFD